MNDDCLLYIFSFLKTTDIGNCLLVCKQYNNLDSNRLWTTLLMRDFRWIIAGTKQDYKSAYIRYRDYIQPIQKLNTLWKKSLSKYYK